MENYYEVGRLICKALKSAELASLNLWLVEEETKKAIKLSEFVNSESRPELGIFKRTS